MFTNLTKEEIKEKQKKIERVINIIAKDRHLCTNNLKPIYDGIRVNTAEKYLKANPRIMWILKEPHDEKDKNGKPMGGGWSIPNNCYKKDDAWKQRTWQPIIYSMFGFYNNQRWLDLDSLRSNPSMVKIMEHIAFINISKMPGTKRSSFTKISNCYKIWKPILKEQVNLYKPNVIIFGGTFKFFANDFFGKISKLKVFRKGGINYITAYKSDKGLLLDTCHPIASFGGFNRGNYVDSIIKALTELSDIQ